MEELIKNIKEILEGIDKTEDINIEANTYEESMATGWWVTSKGAKFGEAKLQEVIQAIREAWLRKD